MVLATFLYGQIEDFGAARDMDGSVTEESGFTLVEVLVVTAIIAILSSLALPIFAVYKADAFNARANADLKNAITAQEAYFEATNAYQSCGPNDCSDVLEGFSSSAGVSLTIVVNSTYYSLAACHMNGSKEFRWDSESGNYEIVEFAGVCNPTPPTLS